MADDLDPLEQHLLAALAALEPRGTPSPRHRPEAEAIWRAQVASRNCDFAARWLQKEGRSFYTIGSAGHESNAAVALALRPTDPALLHYRSGAFYLARAGQVGRDGVPDILLGRHGRDRRADRRRAAQGLRPPRPGGHPADVDDRLAPAARGRASRSRSTAPASSASSAPWPADAIVVCSFGDASLNHATAQAALNTTAHAAHQHLPRAAALRLRGQRPRHQRARRPPGWVAGALSSRPDLRYETASTATTRRRCSRRPRGARRLGARAPAPGRPAPAHRPLPRPRRRRRRGGLPHAARHARRPRPRPAARHRHACSSRRALAPGDQLADEYLDEPRARARGRRSTPRGRPQLATAERGDARRSRRTRRTPSPTLARSTPPRAGASR